MEMNPLFQTRGAHRLFHPGRVRRLLAHIADQVEHGICRGNPGERFNQRQNTLALLNGAHEDELDRSSRLKFPLHTSGRSFPLHARRYNLPGRETADDIADAVQGVVAGGDEKIKMCNEDFLQYFIDLLAETAPLDGPIEMVYDPHDPAAGEVPEEHDEEK